MPTRSPHTLARECFADAADVLVVGARPAFLRALVDRLHELRDSTTAPARVRLLCAPDAVERAFEEFLAATAAAEAVAAGRLTIRVADVDASLSVVDGAVRGRFRLPSGDGEGDRVRDGPRDRVGDSEAGGVLGEPSEEGRLAEALVETYERRWADADEHVPDAPSRERVLETFADRWPDAGTELAAVFDAADRLGTDGAPSPVTVCTLVAARHRILSMRLGEWAEEVGVSSRTEVARAKSRLVDAGLVDTEREPAGVGRPRHRLVVADDRTADATPTALVAAVRARVEE
ncbi:transcriptional regulator TbsP domain-containing protein [Halobaculum lipolyticum]|uniref:DUF5821 family protein n=1 Tax=Halobaculum lipolyticum TaxID=3032001 RepID=A0ABD5W6J4_9EURY|nr:DUF5821 family protein [Halobaculum sp. DT31]